MAHVRLDGAGMVKMKTLDEAMLLLQRIHGLVEMYAMAIKRGQPAGPLVQNLRRTFPVAGGELEGAVWNDLRSGDGGEPRDESRGE